ncbi:MAG: hypothetical protein IJ841_01495 [Prevotella sp.]|nr:hypothetical protein [Prevotella sp.]
MIDSIIFSKAKGTMEVSVSVYVFKENDVFVAYCPSLDLSGYDTTEETARSDFEYALQEYVKFQVEHDTLSKDLMLHGWEVKQRKAKGPEISTLLRRTQLRDVFKKPEYKMIRNTTDLKAAYV